MKQSHLTFLNEQGFGLSATMEWPANQHPHTYAIFAHCFTCGKNLHAVKNISNALAARGFAVLTFDFTGLGNSEGSFTDSSFSSNVDDLMAAAAFLEKQYRAPGLLIGHSLGGAAVIQAAEKLGSVKAIAVIGAPSDTEHLTHLFDKSLPELESKGVARVNIGGRPFTVKQELLDDLREHSITRTLTGLRKSVLIMHSPHDDIVGIENASVLFRAAQHPKSFISLNGADHLLMKKADSLYAGEIIGAWAQRYLEIPDPIQLATQNQTVARIGDKASGYTTLIKTGQHFIIADEPEDVGGNDFGPSPYELLSSSLATCTAMTLRMYANRKNLEVNQILVHVSHSKRHSQDCEKNERIDHLERLIEIAGNLTEHERKRLLEIADKCPVHKTLSSATTIHTEML